MHGLAPTEVIDHDRRFLKLFPDGRERRSSPGHAVKHLRPIISCDQGSEGQQKPPGAGPYPAQRPLSEATLGEARSEIAHGARIRSLGLLTASIVHEVNQPLAAIALNGETCLRWLDRPEPNVEKVRELTRRVVEDARRASEIVDRIRAMAERRAPRQTPLCLADVINESMVFLRHEFQSKRISVSLDLASDLPQIVGDRTQLQQVVVNLAVNAAQAMAESEAARRRISVRTMVSKAGTVCCVIEDSGPGIGPRCLPHLFESFFSTKDSGMGMGLAISHSIIEAHGGQIQADNNSVLGGARFRFSLPAKGAD
jgi:C4-dicarboxylate-specific signal transduction histidine kinase